MVFCSKVIESLDSVWFFTNVLSPKSSPLNLDQKSTQILPKAAEESERARQSQQNYKIVEVKCCSEGSKEEEKAGKRRIGGGGGGGGRRVDIGGGGGVEDDVDGVWIMMVLEGMACWERRFGSQNQAKMPPLSDGMAMKQHLRSWAYSVACAAV